MTHTWISSHVDGVFGFGWGGWEVGVGRGDGEPVHGDADAVLELLGHHGVPAAITEPATAPRGRQGTARPVVHVKDHLYKHTCLL